MRGQIPVYNIDVPRDGPQQPIILSPSNPVYSTYTGLKVGMGNIPIGTPNDAPVGHPNYGQPFHVIEYNPCNGSAMTHMFQRAQRKY